MKGFYRNSAEALARGNGAEVQQMGLAPCPCRSAPSTMVLKLELQVNCVGQRDR